MKKTLFTLVLCVLSASASFAGQRNSDLKLSVFQQQYFLINLDGYRFNRPADEVIIRDLNPGRHYLEVMSACGTQTLFRGNIQVQPNSQIKARVDQRGHFVITHIGRRNHHNSLGAVGPGTMVFSMNSLHNPGWVNNGYLVHTPAPYVSPGLGGMPGQPFGYYTGQAAGYAPGYAALPPMSSGAFQSLMRSLQAQRFDDNRLAMARDAMSRNAFTALQIRDVLYTMSFEASRLEVAKMGYATMVDPHNVHLLTDAFRFSSSTSDLYAYIGR